MKFNQPFQASTPYFSPTLQNKPHLNLHNIHDSQEKDFVPYRGLLRTRIKNQIPRPSTSHHYYPQKKSYQESVIPLSFARNDSFGSYPKRGLSTQNYPAAPLLVLNEQHKVGHAFHARLPAAHPKQSAKQVRTKREPQIIRSKYSENRYPRKMIFYEGKKKSPRQQVRQMVSEFMKNEDIWQDEYSPASRLRPWSQQNITRAKIAPDDSFDCPREITQTKRDVFPTRPNLKRDSLPLDRIARDETYNFTNFVSKRSYENQQSPPGLYPSTILSAESTQKSPGERGLNDSQGKQKLHTPEIKAEIKYLTNQTDKTESGQPTKSPPSEDQFQNDKEYIFKSVDSPNRMKSQKKSEYEKKAHESVFSVNSRVIKSFDNELDKLEEAIKVSRLESKAVANTLHSIKKSLNSPLQLERRKSSTQDAAVNSETGSMRKASCTSDISSVNCQKAGAKKASQQRSSEYLSKIEIRARSQAQTKRGTKFERSIEQPQHLSNIEPYDGNSFYSNPVTQNTFFMKDASPSHFVMNLTTYTWKDIEDYIKNPRNKPRPPTGSIRPKYVREKRKLKPAQGSPQFSLEIGSRSPEYQRPLTSQGNPRAVNPADFRPKGSLRQSAGFKAGGGSIYIGSVSPSSKPNNSPIKRVNKTKQKGGNFLLAKVIGSPISLITRQDPKISYFENKSPSKEESVARRTSQSSMGRKVRPQPRKKNQIKCHRLIRDIPIDTVQRWENYESEIERDSSLQRFIEKKKQGSRHDSRRLSRTSSQSSLANEENGEYRQAMGPKLKQEAKRQRESGEGSPCRLTKKKSLRLKRSMKNKKKSEVPEEQESEEEQRHNENLLIK